MKGGILVSAMVGIDTRSTMDIDATIKNLPLSARSVESILAEIISTGDRITPREIEYQFKLMFEGRSITVLAYNLETVLAEKMETVLSRGTANTRLRDFYDLYILQHDCTQSFDVNTLSAAFRITCAHRKSRAAVSKGAETLHKVRESAEMQNFWTAYQQKFRMLRVSRGRQLWMPFVLCLRFVYLPTKSSFHPHGLKVQLEDGQISRVKEML